MKTQGLSRRDFIKVSTAAGGGLVIALYYPWGTRNAVAAESLDASAFVTVHPDGTVTIMAKNPEVGQGVNTALPMIVADELEVNWEDVEVVQADYHPERYGPQYAGGSTGVTTNWDRLRTAGAVARELLITAAASRWGVDRSTCRASGGIVLHGSGAKVRELSYGDLVEAATDLEAPDPDTVPLKDPEHFHIIGTPRQDVGLAGILDGSCKYGLDVTVAGMLYAAIAKPSTFGGTVESFDASAALRVPGVRKVVELKHLRHKSYMDAGVAVVADNTWAALKGRDALRIVSIDGDHPDESSASLRSQFERLTQEGGEVIREVGDVDAALAGADKKIDAVYEVPFLYHAPIEPMNCIADVKPDRCEIWAPTQVPGACRGLASLITGIHGSNITVHLLRSGGGFGRRLMADYAAEAVTISKAVGKPVKVVWSREDDVRHGYYRPAGLYRLNAGLDADGKLVAWQQSVSTTSRHAYRGEPETAAETEVFPDALPAAVVPNARLSYAMAETSVPTGALRGPGKNANTYVDQCFLDEIAEAADKDPVAIRREIFGEPRDLPYRDHGGPTFNTGRLRNVLDLAVANSAWGRRLPAGRGRGVSAHMMFGAYLAHIAEVSVTKDGQVKVDRVVCAVDCGIVVNPLGAKAQIEGGILFGISSALHGEVTISGSAVVDGNFDTYPLVRIDETPTIEIHFVPSTEHPTGLGEMAYPGTIPAVVNAVYDATGVRVRRLPIRGDDLRSG
jgi:isoquinoline 1-oxidoreductase beta subunit